MNPYLAFGLAMCVIVVLALAGTSYLAVYFNRRAKRDMEEALSPLSQVVDGTFDLDEGSIEGRFRGHLSQAEVTLRPGGMGRVFRVRIFDGAGGDNWLWTLSRSKTAGEAPEEDFEGANEPVRLGMLDSLRGLERNEGLAHIWYRVEYDPEAGHIQLERPMQSRRDIPGPEIFGGLLTALKEIADSNRALQGPERDQSPGEGDVENGSRDQLSKTTGDT